MKGACHAASLAAAMLGVAAWAQAGDADPGNLRKPAPSGYAAGQPAPGDFAALSRTGVRHVIDLRPPSETPDFNEAAAVTAAGMAYYNIPISGADDLTRDNVALLDRLLSRIGDETYLLHCSSSNRVGAMMALRSAWIDAAPASEAMAVGERWGMTGLKPAVADRLRDRIEGGKGE